MSSEYTVWRVFFFQIKSVMSLNGHHLWKSLLDFTDVERDAKGRKQKQDGKHMRFIALGLVRGGLIEIWGFLIKVKKNVLLDSVP